MQHAIDAQASDYMMPDVMKIGGVSGWMRVSAMAQARNIRVSNQLWPEISAQLVRDADRELAGIRGLVDPS